MSIENLRSAAPGNLVVHPFEIYQTYYANRVENRLCPCSRHLRESVSIAVEVVATS